MRSNIKHHGIDTHETSVIPYAGSHRAQSATGKMTQNFGLWNGSRTVTVKVAPALNPLKYEVRLNNI
jgi:hypothetical protein